MKQALIYLYVAAMATAGVLCAATLFTLGLQFLGYVFGA